MALDVITTKSNTHQKRVFIDGDAWTGIMTEIPATVAAVPVTATRTRMARCRVPAG